MKNVTGVSPVYLGMKSNASCKPPISLPPHTAKLPFLLPAPEYKHTHTCSTSQDTQNRHANYISLTEFHHTLNHCHKLFFSRTSSYSFFLFLFIFLSIFFFAANESAILCKAMGTNKNQNRKADPEYVSRRFPNSFRLPLLNFFFRIPMQTLCFYSGIKIYEIARWFHAYFQANSQRKNACRNPVPLSPASLALMTRSDKVLDFRSFSATSGR